MQADDSICLLYTSRLKGYLGWQFYFNIAKQEDICMFMGLKKTFLEKKLPQFDTVIATYPTYGAFLMGIWPVSYTHLYCVHFAEKAIYFP